MCQPARYTAYITSSGLLSQEPFFLVDVGASGGIDAKWSIFGDDLYVCGFDPLVKECERLNARFHQGRSEYVPAFVGAPAKYDFPTGWAARHGLMPRLSVTHANQRLNAKANERYNSFQEVVLSHDHITLDDFFRHSKNKLDFLKIDTDGHDIEVLYGAERLFAEHSFLGICIECQFHGPVHPRANTFANIDIFMRERGFSLFDLEFHRYSRKELPGRFLISIPAQTDIGQVQWADATYFRDLGNIKYSEIWNFPIDRYDIIKLASLYEIHHLHDCAVELINVYKEDLKDILDIEEVIELLVPPMDGKPATLQGYQSRFQQSIIKMKFLQDGDIKKLSDKKKNELKKYERILLFGAGGRSRDNFKKIEAYFNEDINIKFTDNDEKKWGNSICKKEIIPPYEIQDYNPDIVVIVSTYAQEILSQLFQLKDKEKLTFRIVSY